MKLDAFSAKLTLILKVLSISRGALAFELGVDKSVISRWLGGERQPSTHNLARLSNMIAARHAGFCILDWERDLGGLATLFGLEPDRVAVVTPPPTPPALPIANLDQLMQSTAAHGAAYEGLFRTTRADPMLPGCFLREHAMIRRNDAGLLRLTMGSAVNIADGWIMPHQSLVYSIATDRNSGALMFGMFHHRFVSRIDVLDGLVLIPGADMGRSPTASAIFCERVGELSGDEANDDDRFADLTTFPQAIAADSLEDGLRDHLARDVGPDALGRGGEWLLSLTLSRSKTRGPRAARGSADEIDNR
jgi:hypothetical protein